MLSIRLSRTGKIHAPHYRIVVQEKRSKKEGKSIDIIGHYHPAQASKELVIDKEKAAKWLANGAQPSDTVTNLFVKMGILDKSRKIYPFIAPKEVVAEVKAEKAPEAKEAKTEEVVKAEEVAAEEAVIEEMAAEETKEESEVEAEVVADETSEEVEKAE